MKDVEKFNLGIAIAALVISAISLFVSLYHPDPMIYFQTELQAYNKSCLPTINLNDRKFSLGFSNFALEPTPFTLNINGSNIIITDLTSTPNGIIMIEHNNSFNYQVNVLPSTIEKNFVKTFSVRILNKSNANASLNIGYSFGPWNDPLRRIQVNNCNYTLQQKTAENYDPSIWDVVN